MRTHVGVLGMIGILVIAPGMSSAASYLLQDLGSLGESGSYSEDINSAGQVAGFRTVGAAAESFFYTNSSGMTYLTTGGAGTYGGESYRAFLLTPVPEPVSLILFGAGLVAVGGFVARRKMLRIA